MSRWRREVLNIKEIYEYPWEIELKSAMNEYPLIFMMMLMKDFNCNSRGFQYCFAGKDKKFAKRKIIYSLNC